MQAEMIGPVARAVEALGQGAFYDRLLDILGQAAGHDLAALVRYSRTSPPDLILPRIEPTEVMIAYYRDFWMLDPFHTHWAGGGDVGVYRLRAMDAGLGRSRYAREFLSRMAIHDEIAVFLPPLGQAAPTLILDRARGNFTAAEVARVRALFPLLAALHRRHLGILVAEGIDPAGAALGAERPLRLVDQHGAPIFATRAWAGLMAEAGLAVAVAELGQRGPCALRLPGGRTLRRSRLPADFGPAPGGHCDEISLDPAPATGAPGLPGALAQRLTEREQEVVLLTLQGWPVIEIARRLGLSRGTVKNHRLHIYRKLDITTERELFTEYLRALTGGAGD
jgi:DNA-binding CsgD family transcriptional regulator